MTTRPVPDLLAEIKDEWAALIEENKRLTTDNAEMRSAINDLTAQVVTLLAKNTTLRMESERPRNVAGDDR